MPAPIGQDGAVLLWQRPSGSYTYDRGIALERKFRISLGEDHPAHTHLIYTLDRGSALEREFPVSLAVASDDQPEWQWSLSNSVRNALCQSDAFLETVVCIT